MTSALSTAPRMIAILLGIAISSASILVGGKYPTINPEGALNFADYVCKQEEELVFLEVLACAKGTELAYSQRAEAY